jgi:hypothetical protein
VINLLLQFIAILYRSAFAFELYHMFDDISSPFVAFSGARPSSPSRYHFASTRGHSEQTEENASGLIKRDSSKSQRKRVDKPFGSELSDKNEETGMEERWEEASIDGCRKSWAVTGTNDGLRAPQKPARSLFDEVIQSLVLKI